VTTTVASPTPPQHLDALVGKHLIYTYANGWKYELYIKNVNAIDYRIHSGMVGGRWVKDQEVHLVQLSTDSFKCSWSEPTGTSVSLAVDLRQRQLHGVIFFPRWVKLAPEKTICYQNNHLDLMREYRDQGPTYPAFVVDEFAKITFVEDCAADDETVVDRAPDQLPAGYLRARK
jgi:phenolic acid decarboxylase